MKVINNYTNNEGQFVFVTEHGEFVKDITNRNVGVHRYRVTKVSGEWPSKSEIGMFCDNRFDYFGGSVTIIDETTAGVTCYVN